jgi:hypothetical protein
MGGVRGLKMVAYSAVTLICLFVLVVLVTLNLSIQQLVDFESLGFEVENTQDARLKSGGLRMRSADLAELGIFEVSWRWCPNTVILNWCADLNSEPLRAEGQLGYKLSGDLKLSQIRFELSSLSLLGVVAGLLDTRMTGHISSMEITDFDCPMRNARNLNALVEMRDPKILGNQLESIHAEISQTETDYLIDISGDQVTGGFSVSSSLSYSGQGEMTPPSSLVGLMDRMAIPLGNGRYGWELEGEIPC